MVYVHFLIEAKLVSSNGPRSLTRNPPNCKMLDS